MRHLKSLHHPDANMVAAPSDHIIKMTKAFARRSSWTLLPKHSLLTLGYSPTGRIPGMVTSSSTRMRRLSIQDQQGEDVYRKAEPGDGEIFPQERRFLWSAGFSCGTEINLNAFQNNLPDMYNVFEEGRELYNTADEEEFVSAIPSVRISPSITDYGKSKNVFVLSAEFGWSDLGTWRSLHEHVEHDENGNAIVGNVMMKLFGMHHHHFKGEAGCHPGSARFHRGAVGTYCSSAEKTMNSSCATS
jgi:mannose-1-phosphate guanylyltransferase